MKKEKQKKAVLPEALVKEISKKTGFIGQKNLENQKPMPFLYFSLKEPAPEYIKAAQKKSLYRLIKIKN